MKRYYKMIPKYGDGVGFNSMSNSEKGSLYSLAGNTAGNLIEGQQEPYTLQDSGLNQGRMIGSNMLRYGSKGAAIGSTFGVAGTAIGAGVGAIGGALLGNRDFKNQTKDYNTWKTNQLENITQRGISNYNTNIAMGFKPMGNRYATFGSGGTVKPLVIKDPVEYKRRKQAYDDSLDVYNLSTKLNRYYPNTPQISKEEHDRLIKKRKSLPNYEFDTEKYETDKKNNKPINTFEDYIYSAPDSAIYNHPRHIINEKYAVKTKGARDVDKYSNDENDKFAITLKDGSIKRPQSLYDGKPEWDDYTITSPDGNTTRGYYKDFDGKPKLSRIYADKIKPIRTDYYGKDELINLGSMNTSSSSTGWYKEGQKPKFKQTSNKSFTDYSIPVEDVEIYKKPVQPVVYQKPTTPTKPQPKVVTKIDDAPVIRPSEDDKPLKVDKIDISQNNKFSTNKRRYVTRDKFLNSNLGNENDNNNVKNDKSITGVYTNVYDTGTNLFEFDRSKLNDDKSNTTKIINTPVDNSPKFRIQGAGTDMKLGLDTKKQYTKEEIENAAKSKGLDKDIKFNKNMVYFAKGGKLPRYASGGFTPEYEVEKNEVIQGNNVKLSDGGQVSEDMHLAEGVTHDEVNPTTGTTGTLGAGGDRVFSNRSTLLPETIQMLKALKVPVNKNDTHAKVALTVAKKESKFQDKVHSISLRERNSSNQMLQRYSTVKDIIFQDQEIQKPQKEQVPQFKYGGIINKFAKGGRTTTINNSGEFVDNSLKEVNFNESKTNSRFDNLEDINTPTISTTKVPELQPNLIKPTVITPKVITKPIINKPIIKNNVTVTKPIVVKKEVSTAINKSAVKPIVVNKPTINIISPFKTSSDSLEVMNRQDLDYKRYHNFTKRGKDVLNRTDINRNKDSENYIADNISAGDVIIDLGSGLGNTNSKLAGVSVNELYQNKKIKNNAVKIIATDIPSEIKSWEQNKNKYNIDYATVSDTTFKTDINSILKNKGLEKSNHIILRSANSLDLLMNNNQTLEHLNYIASTMKDKKITYIFNNKVMTKNAGDTKFEITADLNNKAFDHNASSWKKNDGKPSYIKRNTNYVKFAMGGRLKKYRYAGEIDPPMQIASWQSNNPLLANSITDNNYNNGIKIVRPNVVSQNNNNDYVTNPNYKEPTNNSTYSPIIKETMTPIEIASPKNRLNIPTAPNMINTELPYNNNKQVAQIKGGDGSNDNSRDMWGTTANTLNLVNNLISVNKLKSFNNPEMPIAPVMRYNSNLPYNIYENAKAGRTALKNMNRYGANPNNKYAVTSSVIEGNNKVFAEDNMRRSDFNNQVSMVKNQIDNQGVQIRNAVNQGKIDLNNTKVTERNNAVNVWATGEMQNKYHNDQIKLEKRGQDLIYGNKDFYKKFSTKALKDEMDAIANKNDPKYKLYEAEYNNRPDKG